MQVLENDKNRDFRQVQAKTIDGKAIPDFQGCDPKNMNQESQLLAALHRQEELLKQLIAVLDKPRLGLHNEGGICKIYCNRQHGLWYTLVNSEPVPIPATSLTGYVKELKFEQLERRGKPCYKLLSTIQADRMYLLESGYDTHFSKGLLLALALLNPQQLLSPITIQPSPGSDESVLFCRVWCGSEYIKASYDESVNWREIAKSAISNVREAQSQHLASSY